jgi:hypothetical protein
MSVTLDNSQIDRLLALLRRRFAMPAIRFSHLLAVLFCFDQSTFRKAAPVFPLGFKPGFAQTNSLVDRSVN